MKKQNAAVILALCLIGFLGWSMRNILTREEASVPPSRAMEAAPSYPRPERPLPPQPADTEEEAEAAILKEKLPVKSPEKSPTRIAQQDSSETPEEPSAPGPKITNSAPPSAAAKAMTVLATTAPASATAPPPVEAATPVASPPPNQIREERLRSLAEFWISLGVGMNYTRLKSDTDILTQTYENISSPSSYMAAGFSVTDRFGFEASLKKTPGKIDNSAISAADSEFIWETVTVHGISVLKERHGRLGESDSAFQILYGIQSHGLPLGLFDMAAQQPFVRKVQTLNLSLGANYDYFPHAKKKFSFGGHIQQALSSSPPPGSALKLSKQFAFDGSVGAAYKVMPMMWTGLYWYGQSHQFDFAYTEKNTTYQGNYSAIYSNIELRLSLDF